ncbi:roadblock/LC7 domain-containing protein [Luteipulveratus halotolerans]|uniref:Dynein regulation protein LC7 n=1 Tax=Luteipulveratus halotolerans TaxID=1631356 RepID=A0A0L6CMB1_9MICO|nr:roadblock/LC7 domain-containing protein [Luteipulveratus halotolerans]KNX38668.1 dynein regulation protein LC7 [Luteipulveratus halotolerans]
MSTETTADGELDWLVTAFVQEVPGAAHAVLVSADGLLIASSERLPPARAEQMAAVSSGLVSLATGAAELFDYGNVLHSVVEMEIGFLLLMSVGNGSHLAVLAAVESDIGQIGYEMGALATRVGAVVQPGARVES